MYIEKHCIHCNKLFSARKAEVKRGNGKFCSSACSNDHKRSVAKKQKINNCICTTCRKQFYRKPSNLANSKSGLHFCSRECKDKAQTINRPYSRKELHLSHFNNGSSCDTYRKLCFEFHEQKCNRCGYNEYPEIIVVHHKDRNRVNNTIDNLEPLCPNCHEVEHFLSRDGRWCK